MTPREAERFAVDHVLYLKDKKLWMKPDDMAESLKGALAAAGFTIVPTALTEAIDAWSDDPVKIERDAKSATLKETNAERRLGFEWASYRAAQGGE